MDARRWRRLAAWAARGAGGLDVGAGVRGEVVGEAVTLGRAADPATPAPPEPVPLAIPGEATWAGRADRRDRRGGRRPRVPLRRAARPRPARPAARRSMPRAPATASTRSASAAVPCPWPTSSAAGASPAPIGRASPSSATPSASSGSSATGSATGPGSPRRRGGSPCFDLRMPARSIRRAGASRPGSDRACPTTSRGRGRPLAKSNPAGSRRP